MAALTLSVIVQLTYGQRLAEELAIFSYFTLCLSVGQALWSLRDERGCWPRDGGHFPRYPDGPVCPTR